MAAPEPKWICCQRGAREHYAIPRALQRRGLLDFLLTDWWLPNGESSIAKRFVPRLAARFHQELRKARIRSFPLQTATGEVLARVDRLPWFPHQQRLNRLFQKSCVAELRKMSKQPQARTVFAFSYAAKEILAFARERGWRTVLGQFDPGPMESEIVLDEYARLGLQSGILYDSPPGYWDEWRQECELADVILVNSRWSAQCLIEKGVSAGKIRAIPCAFESEGSRERSGKEFPEAFSRGRPLKLLFVGQTIIRKGIHLMMEAAAALMDAPVQFAVVGGGLDHPSLRIPPNVTWNGPVPRNDVRHWYERNDVLVLPTLSDGFALVQLEAMSWGLPVLASARCGEVVQDGINGLLLSEVSASALIGALEKLLCSPKWIETMSANAKVTRGFSLEATGDALLKAVA